MKKLLALIVFSVLLLVPVGLTSSLAQELPFGITLPETALPEITTTDNPITTQTDEDNVIFDGGRAAFESALVFQSPLAIIADDFVLNEEVFLTDVHFDVNQMVPDLLEFDFFIYDNDNGNPGSLIVQGSAVNVHRESFDPDAFGGESFRYWFDLDPPVLLQADTIFWLRIDQTNVGPFEALWYISNSPFGNKLSFSSDGGQTWMKQGVDTSLNFVLTGPPPSVVGGELLPIDSTALLVAGVQANALWLIPVIVAAIGIGIVIARKF